MPKKPQRSKKKQSKPKSKKAANSDTPKSQLETESSEQDSGKPLAYEPALGSGANEQSTELQFDASVYDAFAAFGLEWPCLSCVPLTDGLSEQRTRPPFTLFGAAGTQAASSSGNSLALFRLSGLSSPAHTVDDANPDDDDDEKDDEEEDDGKEMGKEANEQSGGSSAQSSRQTLHVRSVPHFGGVNRVRNLPQHSGILACWSELGKVSVYDLRPIARSLAEETGSTTTSKSVSSKPIQVYSKHQCEGYALGWSRATTGTLASGDCKGRVHIWSPDDGMTEWFVRPLSGSSGGAHEGSVEEVVWSSLERSVLVSVGSDQMAHVWDSRQRNATPAMSIHAHSDDINVADWSGAAASMLATGCEDGSFKVWDLRNTPADGSSPVAYFQHHQGPLTGLQWADFESSVIATCASDNQVAFWDLAVEREEEEESSETNAEPPPDLPPQLMFVHRVR